MVLHSTFSCNGLLQCKSADIYVKPTDGFLRQLRLRPFRDGDTYVDAIDRIALTMDTRVCDEPTSADPTQGDTSLSVSGGIRAIRLYESSIEGAQDKVIYDSHLLFELDTGQKIMLRTEPEGAALLSLFPEAAQMDMELLLRVSDV